MLQKTVAGIIMMVLYVILTIYFPPEIIIGKFQEVLTECITPPLIIAPDLSFIKRLVVVFVAGFAVRTRYYFIWIMSMFKNTYAVFMLFTLADSGCNAAGLGFSGYNKLGYAQWDIASGMDVFAIEVIFM